MNYLSSLVLPPFLPMFRYLNFEKLSNSVANGELVHDIRQWS